MANLVPGRPRRQVYRRANTSGSLGASIEALGGQHEAGGGDQKQQPYVSIVDKYTGGPRKTGVNRDLTASSNVNALVNGASGGSSTTCSPSLKDFLLGRSKAGITSAYEPTSKWSSSSQQMMAPPPPLPLPSGQLDPLGAASSTSSTSSSGAQEALLNELRNLPSSSGFKLQPKYSYVLPTPRSKGVDPHQSYPLEPDFPSSYYAAGAYDRGAYAMRPPEPEPQMPHQPQTSTFSPPGQSRYNSVKKSKSYSNFSQVTTNYLTTVKSRFNEWHIFTS